MSSENFTSPSFEKYCSDLENDEHLQIFKNEIYYHRTENMGNDFMIISRNSRALAEWRVDREERNVDIMLYARMVLKMMGKQQQMVQPELDTDKSQRLTNLLLKRSSRCREF